MDGVLVRARPRGRFPAVNVALFVATVGTTLWAGFAQSPLAAQATSLANVIQLGLPFAGSIVAILLAHEMGHYLVARRHGVSATLPYFIPVPFGFGTLGAVIRMRSAIPSRRAALDIAAAGPLAGLAVALPLLVWGLAHSELIKLPQPLVLGPSSPYAVVRALLEGRPLSWPGGSVLFGDSVITWGASLLVHGRLAAGTEVVLHPVGTAAWLGLLVTTLNLVPVGQLDGGHVLYALLGRRGAHLGSRIVSAGLLLAGLLLSWSWLVWWLLTRFIVGLRHPPSLVEEPLDPGRRFVALLCLLFFVLTFIPVPVAT